MSASSPFAIDVPSTLLAEARRGDMRAFERLYRLFERPVFGLALRILGDPDEAMEVMHDAMLKILSSLATFRGDAPFWGWLRQVAANEALMRLRRRQRLSYVEELPEPEPDDASLSLPLMAAETAVLERALAELPDATRGVLWLYHVEGLKHEEIAELMGRTVSYSKSQLARGTRRLRELLKVDAEIRSHA